MRLVFAGTPEFAAVALSHLLADGHEVVLVLTQPDRPAGRKMKMQASQVKQLAQYHNIAVVQPRSLRLDGKYQGDAQTAHAALQATQADAMVVAAYGLLLPQWVLDAFRFGCFNIHASLLPRWRGAAPIHRAIEAGDTHGGVTIMQMDAGLDTGAIAAMESLPILDTDTTGTLHDKLAQMGACLMVQVLKSLEHMALLPQPLTGISYAAKIDKCEAQVDWSVPAQTLCRRVRAFNPSPGAFTLWEGDLLKIWSAQVADTKAPKSASYGQIMAVTLAGIAVAAIDSIVLLTQLQRSGGKRLALADFLHGTHLQPGQVLGEIHVDTQQ